MSLNTKEHESFLSLPKGRGNIVFIRDGDLATLWLDNPSARNALSLNMMHQFLNVLNELISNCPRVLVVRGRHGHFCAGGDLRDVKEHLLFPEVGAQMSLYMNWVLGRIKELGCFVVVVIEGAAIGGGAELAVLGDYILATRFSKIGFVQLNLGVTPGWGGAQRLVRRVGHTKAVQILTLGRIYSSDAALQLGLIDEISDSIEASISDLLEELLSKPVNSMRNLVQWMKQVDEENESKLFKKTWASIEHLNALGLSETS